MKVIDNERLTRKKQKSSCRRLWWSIFLFSSYKHLSIDAVDLFFSGAEEGHARYKLCPDHELPFHTPCSRCLPPRSLIVGCWQADIVRSGKRRLEVSGLIRLWEAEDSIAVFFEQMTNLSAFGPSLRAEPSRAEPSYPQWYCLWFMLIGD